MCLVRSNNWTHIYSKFIFYSLRTLKKFVKIIRCVYSCQYAFAHLLNERRFYKTNQYFLFARDGLRNSALLFCEENQKYSFCFRKVFCDFGLFPQATFREKNSAMRTRNFFFTPGLHLQRKFQLCTGCERCWRPFFDTNINLHKTFKNNNRLMKLSGIVYFYLDFTFGGWNRL